MNILIVDDDRDLARKIYTYLQLEGYEVDLVKNGGEALHHLDDNQVDLVISDINMPVLDGVGLLKYIRQFHPEVEVILMTGYADLDSSKAAIDHRAWAYLTKPFRLDKLMRSIQEIQDRKLPSSQTEEPLPFQAIKNIREHSHIISQRVRFLEREILPDLLYQLGQVGEGESQLRLLGQLIQGAIHKISESSQAIERLASGG